MILKPLSKKESRVVLGLEKYCFIGIPKEMQLIDIVIHEIQNLFFFAQLEQINWILIVQFMVFRENKEISFAIQPTTKPSLAIGLNNNLSPPTDYLWVHRKIVSIAEWGSEILDITDFRGIVSLTHEGYQYVHHVVPSIDFDHLLLGVDPQDGSVPAVQLAQRLLPFYHRWEFQHSYPLFLNSIFITFWSKAKKGNWKRGGLSFCEDREAREMKMGSILLGKGIWGWVFGYLLIDGAMRSVGKCFGCQ